MSYLHNKLIKKLFFLLILIIFSSSSFSEVVYSDSFSVLAQKLIEKTTSKNINIEEAGIISKIIAQKLKNNNINISSKNDLYLLSKLVEHSYYSTFNELDYFLKKFKKESIKNNKNFLETYYLINGYILEYTDENKAIHSYNEAIKYGLINKNNEILFDTYMSLARLYIHKKNYILSLENIEKSKKYITSVSSELLIIDTKVEYYYYLNMYELSLSENIKLMDKLMLIKEGEIKNYILIDYKLAFYLMQSLLYFKLNRLEESIIYSNKAIKLANEIKDDFEIIYGNIVLVNSLISSGDIILAKNSLELIKSKYDKFKDDADIYYNVEVIRHLYYKKIKNYKKSYEIIKALEKRVQKTEPRFVYRLYVFVSEISHDLGYNEESLNYRNKYINHLISNHNEKSITFANFYEQKKNKINLSNNKILLNKKLKKNKKGILLAKKEIKTLNKLLKNNILISVFLVILVLIILFFRIKYYKISNKDVLTNLSNRRFLNKSSDKVFRTGKVFSYILFDLDDFKSINDTYGHNVGDKVIKEIARIMKEETRSGDVLSRVGGEEFIVLTKNNLAVTKTIAERIRLSIQNNNFNKIEKNLKVTASFGISTNKNKEKTLSEMYEESDKNLYISKHGGKNIVTY
jgi:diguanylate cyclase (GGDEF)-like protein